MWDRDGERYVINTDALYDVHARAPAQRIYKFLCIFCTNFIISRFSIGRCLNIVCVQWKLLCSCERKIKAEKELEKPSSDRKFEIKQFSWKCAKFSKWFNTNLCPKTLKTQNVFFFFFFSMCVYSRKIFATICLTHWTNQNELTTPFPYYLRYKFLRWSRLLATYGHFQA